MTSFSRRIFFGGCAAAPALLAAVDEGEGGRDDLVPNRAEEAECPISIEAAEKRGKGWARLGSLFEELRGDYSGE